jgi:shikimate kinase
MTGPHIVVLGLMGAGKSTVATALATRFARPWRDSDADIETLMGRTGREIAADSALGVGALHSLEEAVLLGALARDEPCVISAAGWVVESEVCRQSLARRATTVWLQAPAEVLRERMATGRHRRTSAPGELEALIARRTPMFHAVATVTLDASLPSDQVISAALAALAAPPPPRTE